MTFRNLLVHVGTDRGLAARLDFAARFAAAHNAYLTALHIPSLPRIPGYVMAELSGAILESRERQIAEEATALAATVEKTGRAVGIQIEWRHVKGEVPDAAMMHARHVDLSIVGQGLDDRGEGADGLVDLVEGLLLGSGRPVLAVPSYGTFQTLGERVLIAWNATREAARALNDALPIMSRAKQVTVLSIDPREGERRAPGADISLHLARHGVKVEAATAYADDLDVGDVLLSRAADLGADMIVMGGYGHSRTREIVLGGVTRHILKHMTVPAFMSH